MADFDAIYEDHSLETSAAIPGASAGSGGSASGTGGGLDAPTLVPDPIVVRGAGNITV